MADFEQSLREILTQELLLSAYHLKFPFAKASEPSGAVVGRYNFKPDLKYIQAFYDLTFHKALVPLSKLPLDQLLSFNLTKILPPPDARSYPEQALGLVTVLDQTRVLTKGYSFRYTRAFFDPICEKLARQLISLPADLRPDGKHAWISRRYTFDEWLCRTLWFWAPLVHSDMFMTADRQVLKDWLHSMRHEVEKHAGVLDPFAPLEAEDDVDICAFKRIEAAGPPQHSYGDADSEATVVDYAFWWIRILNSHFPITDMCGHYPYWIRWKGEDWSAADREFMEKTKNYRYDPADEPALREVKEDSLRGLWRLLQPTPKYEKGTV